MNDPVKPKPASKRQRTAMRLGILGLGLTLIGVVAGLAGIIGAYFYASPNLPAAETIRDIPLQMPLRVYSRDGRLISEIGQRKRVLVDYNDVPDHVVQAFVSAEDRRFFEHSGIDPIGIGRALFLLVKTGEIAGGGSTLTQQLARDYFLTREQTLVRKLNEAFLAWKIEQEFTKEQIMALFLNKMFFGQRAYGVAAAAQVYFNKPLEALTVAEAATLAGVLPAPSRYNPVRSPRDATVRRNYVLGRMLSLDYIDEQTYDEAFNTPMESNLYGAAVEVEAPYVAEMVRREMLSRYGEETYTAGYQVFTSLDSELQQAGNYALKNGLLEFTRRRGFRGPIASFDISETPLDNEIEAWSIEILDSLRQYAPGDLEVAIVTAVNEEDNSANIRFSGGTDGEIPWIGMKWAKPFIDRETTGPAPESVVDVLTPGDIIYVMPTSDDFWALSNAPEVQGSVVSMDPYDGAITSLIGGFDFAISKFNRATQAERQPGSAFKPFIYSAALAAGNTAATVVDDSPVVIRSSELEKDWRPINYSGRFYGPTRLREALVRSMNLVSVRLLLYETGIGNTVRHISKFGFSSRALPRNGSLALGGGNTSPLDMVQGYATIANGGFAVKPYFLDAIYGPDGEELYRSDPLVVCRECLADEQKPSRFALEQVPEYTFTEMAELGLDYRPDNDDYPQQLDGIRAAGEAIPEQNAYIIQDMMRDVVRRGTGRRALTLGRRDLSGKTGTSNDRRDAWFGGFNGRLAGIVWIGFDDDAPLGPGEEGSRTALPVWIKFMEKALADAPNSQMAMPEGIVNLRIDRKTGCPARAGASNSTFEIFRAGNEPECEELIDVPVLDIDGSNSDEDEEPLF
ncbi:MAG: PBP1A family penicillin-binding protein [Pseudomonadota bacterium]